MSVCKYVTTHTNKIVTSSAFLEFLPSTGEENRGISTFATGWRVLARRVGQAWQKVTCAKSHTDKPMCALRERIRPCVGHVLFQRYVI